jgi:hypothetical protein
MNQTQIRQTVYATRRPPRLSQALFRAGVAAFLIIGAAIVAVGFWLITP